MSDLIDRRAAIDAIKSLWNNAPSAQHLSAMLDCEDAIQALPSAEPERKKGKWIPHKSIFGGLGEKVYTCDQCGYNIGFHTENFCPRCGSYNGGEQDDSV